MRTPPPPCGCVGVRRARVHVPRRVPPRGARQNRLRVMFPAVGCRVWGSDVTFGACTARRFALPAARSPSPCAIRRARRAGRRFPLPLGRGCALSRRGARILRSPPPPTPRRGLPSCRRFARAASGERYAFAPRHAPRFACFFHFLAAFAAAVRRPCRGGVTPRPRRARSPSRWRAPGMPLSCPVSFLPFGNVPAACFPLRRVVRSAQ